MVKVDGVHGCYGSVYVCEVKVRQELVQAQGTGSLRYDQAVLDVVPHHMGAVLCFIGRRIAVHTHGRVPSI